MEETIHLSRMQTSRNNIWWWLGGKGGDGKEEKCVEANV